MDTVGGTVATAFLLPAYAYSVAAAQRRGQQRELQAGRQPSPRQRFLLEIGNAGGKIAYGSQGNSPPASSQALYVDSASKWLFASYVPQARSGLAGCTGTGGGYTSSDVAYLQMGNSYDNINDLTCTSSDTIAHATARAATTRTQTSADIGKFYYSSGEFLAWPTTAWAWAATTTPRSVPPSARRWRSA